MSVILEFTQIKKNEKSIIGQLPACNIYEISQDWAVRGRACVLRNTDLFQQLLTDREIWQGEVYNIPAIHNYVFYLLAMDFENEIGHRMVEDGIVFLAFDPKPIQLIVTQAVKDVPTVGTAFNELAVLLDEAVEQDFLIGVQWG